MRYYLTALGVGVATAYCIYFDHKRRHAPDYQSKVRARRDAERKKREQDEEIQLPPLDDPSAIEKFFVKEIEIGEELMQAGEVDRAVKHLSYAVALCPQAQQLLQYMREVLPPSAYLALCNNLKTVNKRVTEHFSGIRILKEDDVE